MGKRVENISEDVADDQGYFRGLICTDPFRVSLVSSDKNVILFLVQRGHFSHKNSGDLC